MSRAPGAARPGEDQRVELVRTDLIAGIAGPIQLVLANLPYIPSERKLPLTVARFEPHAALFSGSTGMDLNRRLLHEAVKLMAAGGEIALEMDEGQGTDLSALAFRLYSGATVEVLRDAAGLERVVHVRLAD